MHMVLRSQAICLTRLADEWQGRVSGVLIVHLGTLRPAAFGVSRDEYLDEAPDQLLGVANNSIRVVFWFPKRQSPKAPLDAPLECLISFKSN